MKDIICDVVSKLTRYDWVTTLLPGLFLVCLLKALCIIDLTGGLWHEKSAVIFFLGLVCSRVGASIVEPLTRNVFKWEYNYEDYLDWSKAEEKKASLLIANSNWFRSMVGMMLTGTIVTLVRFWLSASMAKWLGCIFLLVLFADAYRRQVGFIKKGIEKYKKELVTK